MRTRKPSSRRPYSVVLPLAAVGGIGYLYFKRGSKPKALRAGR